MKIGRMNDPEKDLVEELQWTAHHKFHFIDLTVEPPKATFRDIRNQGIRQRLEDLELEVVGHSPYYIPIQSPIKAVREASLSEFLRLLELFKELGADRMTVHFMRPPPLLARDDVVQGYLEVLTPLCERAKKLDMVLQMENTFGVSNQIDYFGKLLGELPDLGCHLDVAHAYLERQWDAPFIYMKQFGKRLTHIHLSENNGQQDQHLPMGVVPRGSFDWPKIVRLLKKTGYDDTITLEIFSPDRRYILDSREKLLELWNA